ncbi:MAG: hypothetical protein AABZ10_12470 [Nitrospirota bacterium]
MKQFKSIRYSNVMMMLSAALLLILPAIGRADVTVPSTFASGTTISSSQVNANFSALADAMPGVKTSTGTVLTSITGTAGNNATSIMSMSVTPPVSGNVIVIGSGTIFFNQSVPKYNRATFSLNTTAGVTKYPEYVTASFGPRDEAAPGVAQLVAQSLNIVDVFPVTGGITTTIYLNAHRDATGINTIQAEYPRLTAIFVPNTLP